MKSKSPKMNDLGRYSHLAFQMGIIIFLGAFGGVKLDELCHTKPVFTLIGALGSIAIAMYTTIKEVNANHKNNGKKYPN